MTVLFIDDTQRNVEGALAIGREQSAGSSRMVTNRFTISSQPTTSTSSLYVVPPWSQDHD